MPAAPYPDRARFDARDKVLGATRFTADLPHANILYAMPVPARVAKGRLTALSTDAAMRAPGVVSVADCGRVISPRTSASQVRGGVVWAIGSALREETEVDER